MGFYLVQSGSTLQKMTTGGALTTFTLPSGVTVDATKRMRAAVLGNFVVVVNSPSENITVDRYDVVRLLCPRAPSTRPVLTKASSGTLSGTFRVKETYLIKDAFGNILAESNFGPTSDASATLASEYLVSTASLSSQPGISARRLYRTTTGPGATYFHWIDVDGNTVQSVQNDLSDAGLEIIAAPTDLGSPPKFSNVVNWKNRLWGYGPDAPDNLYQGANGKAYAFPSSRVIAVPPVKADTVGLTGFLARKDELIVGKRNSIHKIYGTSETNFTRALVTDRIGFWATDSGVVVGDVGYFLGTPFGVYEYGTSGLQSITNERVNAWFTKDDTFNRAMFDDAIGFYHPGLHAYCLLLAAAGSSNLDRWIVYDIAAKTWWGPHKTDEFTPTGAANLRNGDDILIYGLLASNGKIYREQATKTDGAATAIDMDATLNRLSGDNPAIHKTWLQPEIVSKIQAGGTLTVTPTVGKTSASAGVAISHDMTKGHETLRRLGDGELCQLRFRENTAGQDATIYGVEVPFFENGRRG
jgi:hypothetical protein